MSPLGNHGEISSKRTMLEAAKQPTKGKSSYYSLQVGHVKPIPFRVHDVKSVVTQQRNESGEIVAIMTG